MLFCPSKKNKSKSPARLSSPNQSIRGKSISLRRAVSPKVIFHIHDVFITRSMYESKHNIISF